MVAAEGSARWAVVVTATPAAEAPAAEAPAVATPAAAAIRAYPMVAVLVVAVLGEIGRFAGSDVRCIGFREVPPILSPYDTDGHSLSRHRRLLSEATLSRRLGVQHRQTLFHSQFLTIPITLPAHPDH